MENIPSRILLWAPNGSGSHYGGPGMAAHRLYGKLTREQGTVSLAHGLSHQKSSNVFVSSHLIHHLNGSSRNVPAFLFKTRRWLQKMYNRWDVFHGLQGFHTTVLPAFWAEQLGVPAVVKLAAHESDLAEKGGLRSIVGLNRQRIKLLNRISGVIAISQEIVDELLDYGIAESRIAHIPNAVRTDLFHPVANEAKRDQVRVELGWPIERKVILFSGTVVERKQPHLLILALKELMKQNIDAHIVFAGPTEPNSEYIKYMESLAHEFELTDRITFTGFVRNIAPMYQAADAFSLPSKSEGMANALLEAMACGLPVVVTEFSGTRELVTPGIHGEIVAANPAEIALALANYLVNHKLARQTGLNASTKIHASYSTEYLLQSHLDLFSRIRNGKPATNIF